MVQIKTNLDYQPDNLEESNPSKWAKRSNFYLTINSNQAMHCIGDTDQLQKKSQLTKQRFKAIISHILDSDNIVDYIKILNKGDTMDKVKNIQVDTVIEIGDKTKKLHCHSLVYVEHNTRVQLDLAKIKKEIINALKVKNIYMDCRIFKDHKKSLEHYIYKTNQSRI